MIQVLTSTLPIWSNFFSFFATKQASDKMYCALFLPEEKKGGKTMCFLSAGLENNILPKFGQSLCSFTGKPTTGNHDVLRYINCNDDHERHCTQSNSDLSAWKFTYSHKWSVSSVKPRRRKKKKPKTIHTYPCVKIKRNYAQTEKRSHQYYTVFTQINYVDK